MFSTKALHDRKSISLCFFVPFPQISKIIGGFEITTHYSNKGYYADNQQCRNRNCNIKVCRGQFSVFKPIRGCKVLLGIIFCIICILNIIFKKIFHGVRYIILLNSPSIPLRHFHRCEYRSRRKQIQSASMKHFA